MSQQEDKRTALIQRLIPILGQLSDDQIESLLSKRDDQLATVLTGVIRFRAGDREYEAIPVTELYPVDAQSMIRQIEELDTNLGEEEAQYLLAFMNGIPYELRNCRLLFPGWRSGENIARLKCMNDGHEWYQRWDRIEDGADRSDRLVRRIK